ncbi:hypothetical protein K2173_019020 [Erythroxylum novogranatense]|uniref:Acetolactate synthase small subunit-like ACT domain-containing protein n=1 Tax=Erythroxylum novogranatense TaxID=1862640 RepID=A0AAV8SSH3_9ROSI|nr:hypothetical protein K2173_019020 [Erythroxylum novogranatense]
MLVNDALGVLNIVTGVFSRKGYNIQVHLVLVFFLASLSFSQDLLIIAIIISCQSLAVGYVETEDLSRITTVVPGTDESISKLVQQLYKLAQIHKLWDLSHLPFAERGLMLIKIAVLLLDVMSLTLPAFLEPKLLFSAYVLSVSLRDYYIPRSYIIIK